MEKKNDKKMTAQEYQDKALTKFADLMIEHIKGLRSNSGWTKPWICEGCTGWATNLDGREYNGMNAMMLILWCQHRGFDLPIFATFDRVVSLNFTKDNTGKSVAVKGEDGKPLPFCHVNKGEESFPVFITTFSCFHKETKEYIKYSDYCKLPESEKEQYNKYPRLNTYNVFNIAQTNIKETRPELYAKLAKRYGVSDKPVTITPDDFSFEPVDKIIRDRSWVCPIQITHGNDAYYSVTNDIIVYPEKSQFRDGELFYSNLFHEMAHSTGAKSRLDRLPQAKFGSPEYAKEELVAELTAALVGSRYGIVKHIKDDSAEYIKGWLKSLKETPAFIKSVLVDVRRASKIISDCIDTAAVAQETQVA